MATNFEVKLTPGMSIEKAIRIFSRLFWKTGTKQDINRHLQFTSPSERRAKHNLHIRRQNKRLKKQKKP
ncbi:MAG: 30S ribosomal protein S21 [Patescibacteria group bacterium]